MNHTRIDGRDALSLSGRVATETDTDGLQPAAMLEILSNKRRRCAIAYLTENDDPLEFRDVVDHVASIELGKPPEQISYDERKTVYTSLQQTHMDTLDKHNVIEYDRKTGTIRTTEHADRLREQLVTLYNHQSEEKRGLFSRVSAAF